MEDLTHWLTLDNLTKTSQRDPYTGQKRHRSDEARMPCFFDATIRSVEVSAGAKKVKVSGTIFVAVGEKVNENDIVTKIEDSRGNVLMDKRLRVMGVMIFNDEDGAHHQEIYILEDHAS